MRAKVRFVMAVVIICGALGAGRPDSGASIIGVNFARKLFISKAETKMAHTHIAKDVLIFGSDTAQPHPLNHRLVLAVYTTVQFAWLSYHM